MTTIDSPSTTYFDRTPWRSGITGRRSVSKGANEIAAGPGRSGGLALLPTQPLGGNTNGFRRSCRRKSIHSGCMRSPRSRSMLEAAGAGSGWPRSSTARWPPTAPIVAGPWRRRLAGRAATRWPTRPRPTCAGSPVPPHRPKQCRPGQGRGQRLRDAFTATVPPSAIDANRARPRSLERHQCHRL